VRESRESLSKTENGKPFSESPKLPLVSGLNPNRTRLSRIPRTGSLISRRNPLISPEEKVADFKITRKFEISIDILVRNFN